MAKSKTFGVGLRTAHVFNLDADGLPMPAVASATLIGGTLIEGIKTLPVTDPEPRRITHSGDDRNLAQDSLPALESGSFNFTTSKTNFDLDAMLEGGLVRTINGNKYTGGNTDNKGSEPQMLFVAYRQALDGDKNSASYGKLRQWEGRAYGSTRIAKQTPAYEAANTDISYSATPTPTRYTHWNEQFNETNWGFTEAEYINDTSDYHPRWNFGRGNGTLTAFNVTHPPVDSSSVTVWVDGTEVTPTNVNTVVATPNFTLGVAAANNKLIAVKIETNAPGSN